MIYSGMNELSQFLNPGLLSCIGQFCCFLFLKPIPTQPHQKESWKGLLTLKTSLFSEFFFPVTAFGGDGRERTGEEKWGHCLPTGMLGFPRRNDYSRIAQTWGNFPL